MHAIVAAALKQRILVIILAVTLMIGGLFAYKTLNIEAYPDPVPPLVDIITQNPGQSSEEIERYITVPIEIQMAGLPYVQAIRTISLFGLSDVKVQFTYDVTYQQASQYVVNRLSQLGPLPNGAQPVLSPTSPIGEIFRYRVTGPPGFTATDLKTIQDWILQRRFKAIPGVIDVTGWGGRTKTYDITIDLDRLLAYRLTLKQVLDGSDAWITGIRREQSTTRQSARKIELDERRGVIKVQPLADWTSSPNGSATSWSWSPKVSPTPRSRGRW